MKYVLTQDTGAIAETLFEQSDTTLNNTYFTSLTDALRASDVGKEYDITPHQESQIQRSLTESVAAILREEDGAFILCVDRYLLPTIEKSFPEQFFRFSITRTVEDEKVPRKGDSSFEDQLLALKKIVSESPITKIILVDDGIFSGGTMQSIVQLFRNNGIDVDQILVYLAKDTTAIENVPVAAMSEEPQLEEWIDIRDFSVFGGRLLRRSEAGRQDFAIPYLAPWSDGSMASLSLSGDFFTISQKMIGALQGVIREYERRSGTYLTFADLEEKKFPWPLQLAGLHTVNPDTSIYDYLCDCRELIERESWREVEIFDMDGTLYTLDGENNGYAGSTLEKRVFENLVKHIIERENLSQTKAEALAQEGIDYSEGASRFFSKRYGYSEKDYFHTVWDIAADFINPREENIKRVQGCSGGYFGAQGKKPILLTSAPKIWAVRVLKQLGLQGAFEGIYTAEDFMQKGDIFGMLARRYEAERMTSIGDQYESDIILAEQYGMKGELV